MSYTCGLKNDYNILKMDEERNAHVKKLTIGKEA